MNGFGLDENRKLRTFSKGMKKQVSVICGVCSGTDYIILRRDLRRSRPGDAPDGKEPVCRAMWRSGGLTPIIASHNLRELEDICDHVGLLHQAAASCSRSDLDDMKLGMYIRCSAFSNQKSAAGFRVGRL